MVPPQKHSERSCVRQCGGARAAQAVTGARRGQAGMPAGTPPGRWAAPVIPRGDLQSTFIFKGFDDVRRLGLRPETEAAVRASAAAPGSLGAHAARAACARRARSGACAPHDRACARARQQPVAGMACPRVAARAAAQRSAPHHARELGGRTRSPRCVPHAVCLVRAIYI